MFQPVDNCRNPETKTRQDIFCPRTRGTATKNAYNDANPSDDVANTFVPEIVAELTKLHNGLADDLIALGLAPCSK